MTDLIISGVIDGPLSGGTPKAIELYALNNIADLSIYGIGSANNGDGSDGEEFTLSGSATAGDFIYIASETSQFTSFFGFGPTFTSSAASINGDDAIELFKDGSVIDLFGDINTDGSGEPWEYMDGWAYRQLNSVPSTTFNLSEWTFSGPNELDGESSNSTATTPFPIGTFSANSSGDPIVSITASDANANEALQDPGTFTLNRTGDTDSALTATYTLSGDASNSDYTPTLSGSVTFGAGESSVDITITPVDDTDIETDETLTLTLVDGADYDLSGNSSATVTIGDNDAPIPLTLISAIQGSGFSSPLDGNDVTVEAIVVGDFQGSDGLRGFYLQEEDTDADADVTTSEGLFIFDDDFGTDVAVGDKVQVSGTVDERFGNLTSLIDVTDVTVVSNNETLPTAATLNLPFASDDALEAIEGMSVNIPDTLFVTEFFNLDRFGQIRLSADGTSNAPNTDGRLDQFTQFNAPDVASFAAYQDEIAKRQIILDDGSTTQNPSTIIFGRGGQPLSSTNTLRGGDTITDLSGVLSFDFGEYRIQTNQGVDFQPTNPRPATPDNVGGSLKLASLNVLNFFTTLDVSGNPGSGPNGLDPRGADSIDEFDRQLEKLVTAIEGLDADIIGLVELENEFGDTNGDGEFAIGALVDALNASASSTIYAFVDPGQSFVDTSDAISVGAIYKTETVKIADGTTVEILTDSDLPALGLGGNGPVFDGSSTNRAPLAVTFEEISSGAEFTVAVNHFKSKGGTGSGDNADIGDGQGNFNGTRTRGAEALAAWLDTDPTGSGDSDYLIIGDLNAYTEEDPITTLEAAGYTDLVQQFLGDEAYSFVFDGQWGTLDYTLANSSLLSQITGATEWHINADEPDALDYNLDFGRDPALFDGQIPFRTSDHDPILIGLDLDSDFIIGTEEGELLRGTPEEDIIQGLGGNDTLLGLASDDLLEGGNDVDVLRGGDGNDELLGGNDRDRLFGDGNNDTLLGEDGRDLLFGGDGDDDLLGGGSDDELTGGNGSDFLKGEGGNDTLIGVDPTALVPGNGEVDRLVGNNGADTFVLGDASNVFYLGGNTDFGLVLDLDLSEGDTIQLGGGASDYRLRVRNNDTLILSRQSTGTDLIGRVKNVSLSDFSTGFDFVS